MKTSWKEDFLLPKGKELLKDEDYRSYAKLVSHERYIMKKSYKNEISIEHYEIIDNLKNNEMIETMHSVEEMAIASVMKKSMMECLAKLTESDRILIEELYFRNPSLSNSKIAKKLGIPRTTMQSREKRILEILRRMIEKG